MKLRKNIPTVYDEDYPLDCEEQGAVIEMSIMNAFLLDQLTMPMVADLYGGPEITAFFQRCVAAGILAFLQKSLLTEEFYIQHKAFLDAEHGLRPDVVLDVTSIYNIAYDLHRMLCQYMVVMGHQEEMLPKRTAPSKGMRFFYPEYPQEQTSTS